MEYLSSYGIILHAVAAIWIALALRSFAKELRDDHSSDVGFGLYALFVTGGLVLLVHLYHSIGLGQ